jgi:large subunit ribosomal protein L35
VPAPFAASLLSALENLQIRVGSAITRAPAARLIKGCRGGGEVLKSMIPESGLPVSGKDHAQIQIKHGKSQRARFGDRRRRFAGGTDQESKMPKMKTKSGAKKRFKVTGSGKVLYAQSRKRHGMIKRTKKQIRQLRGTNVLFKTDGDNIKKYFLPNG